MNINHRFIILIQIGLSFSFNSNNNYFHVCTIDLYFLESISQGEYLWSMMVLFTFFPVYYWHQLSFTSFRYFHSLGNSVFFVLQIYWWPSQMQIMTTNIYPLKLCLGQACGCKFFIFHFYRINDFWCWLFNEQNWKTRESYVFKSSDQVRNQ